MLHRILGASLLNALSPGVDPMPALDEAVALRWNAVRIFCGALPWSGQELSHVYANLPRVLEACGARGLNAYLGYHTEAGTGYDLDRHTDEVEAIARAYQTIVLREVANEADHETQGGRLPPERCRDLAARMDGTAIYGATITDDESMVYAGRDANAVHLDRGRDPWNMVRRVREIYGRSEANGLPSKNQEPIGADEINDPGRRLNDPAIFRTMGILGRLFDCSSFFHSEDGRYSRLLRPVTRSCAEAFAAGFLAWPAPDELTYKNTGHGGSPVKAANFDKVIRVYSGVMPNGVEALTVPLGLTESVDASAVELNSGWRWSDLLAEDIAQDGRKLQIWRTVYDGAAMQAAAAPERKNRYPVDTYRRRPRIDDGGRTSGRSS
jgi:hypothetical protein